LRILFISSGFSGIYPSFESTIEEAFLTFNHSLLKIAPVYTKEIVEQIESFNPDFVMTFVGYKMDKGLLQLLMKKGIALGVWLTEDPFYIDQSVILIEDYDYVFTIDLGAYEYYKEKFKDKKIYHLPLGTDPSRFYPSNVPTPYIYDLCLVGYPYSERIEFVKYILNHTPHSMLLAGPHWRKYIKSKGTERLKIINHWIEPEFVRQIFSLSKIILNPHRSYDFYKNLNSLGIEAKSINNRTFDIAACGGFQLIPNKPDLARHFNTSQDIISYSSYDECVQLIYQYVNDEKLRDFYRQNARERVLNSHSFNQRVEFILKQIINEV
jgi:spore maturation protein CgeB